MKKTIIVACICLGLLIIAYFQYKSNVKSDPRGNLFAGSAACVKCHGKLYNSYLHTAHFLAALPGNQHTIHGSFAKGQNVYNLSASQKIVMEAHSHGLYQTYYLNGKVKESHRFDIVLGGIKGETYLYWKGNALYQLLVSYYTKKNQWELSPRYAPGQVDFNRIITKRCLECHASYIADQPNATPGLAGAEQFDKKSLVFSIDCERCHGPGAQHVDFQTNNPGVKTARFIATYASLTRSQKVDMCAQCHSGNKSQMIRSIFYFMPGNALAQFKLPDFPDADTSHHIDVHGNQVQLLQSSKCFLNSKMDCATCHDTHQNQRGNTILFTQKCLGCHSTINHNYCKMANASNAQLIKSNCIQCHMPAFASSVIVTANADKTPSADILVHTHHIAIYPQEAKKILMMIGK